MASHRPVRGRRRLIGLVSITATMLGTGALALGQSGFVADVPSVPATRGIAAQVTDTLPPPLRCDRVIVIGDSLTDNSRPWLVIGLRTAGFTAHVDAQPSRRIPGHVRAPYSGVQAARTVRATWGEAECWLIALGSNDLIKGADHPAAVASLIDEMVAEVTPGAHVWWMNLDYHRDSRTSFDFEAATATFNAELDAAAADPDFDVIDWYSFAEAHPSWFFDPVHVNREGSIERAIQMVAALPR